MQNITKLVLMSCLLAGGMARSVAQNTDVIIVQELTVKLTGYYQMNDTENAKKLFRHAGKISISNKDIINLLEGPTGLVFSPNATLMMFSSAPVDLTPTIVVRDKFEGDTFDTDVTQYFGAQLLASIEDGQINKNPLKGQGVSYDVLAFTMQIPGVEFQIQGFGKTKISTGKFEGEPAAIVHTGKLSANGAGDYKITPLSDAVRVALTGTVTVSGNNLKAVQ